MVHDTIHDFYIITYSIHFNGLEHFKYNINFFYLFFRFIYFTYPKITTIRHSSLHSTPSLDPSYSPNVTIHPNNLYPSDTFNIDSFIDSLHSIF